MENGDIPYTIHIRNHDVPYRMKQINSLIGHCYVYAIVRKDAP